MDSARKTNSLAIVSSISGIVVLFSLGVYYGLSQTVLTNLNIFSIPTMNRLRLILMDLSVPIRNIFAPLAILTGFFGLREIKKNEMMQKGKPLAWIGIFLGGGWIILGVLVSVIFLVAKIL